MLRATFSTRENNGPLEVRFGLWRHQLQRKIVLFMYLLRCILIFVETRRKQHGITCFQIKNQFPQ